ncbi:MAG TPA: potassium transporter TrkG [Bacteroidales bacterium]|nr:potassium transporter TrkG [Bacteroidales bacterium]
MSEPKDNFSVRLNKTTIRKWVQTTSFLFSLSAILLIVYEMGFTTSETRITNIKDYYFAALIILFIFSIVRYLFFFPKKQRIEAWIFDLIFICAVALLIVKKIFFFYSANEFLLFFDYKPWLYILLFYAFYKESTIIGIDIFSRHINPALIFVISFVLLILIGTLLLLLPNATTNGISVMNSLFTSTSAVCVTGLAVVDTEFCFSLTGKIIILCLIQAGGLGIMTFTSYFTYFFKGKPTFQSQLVLSDIANSDTMTEVFQVFKKILLITFIIEGVGALLIYINLPSDLSMNNAHKIFFSVFHSVSAFCNAGFSTLSDNFHDIYFRYNYPVHMIISFLIIFGGLGFPIIFNFLKYLRHLIVNRIFRLNKHREFIHKAWVINLNTRIVTLTTLILLVAGTLIFFFLEYNNTLAEHHGIGKWVTSFFSMVSPRTAGFNSINYGMLHVSTILVIILLMWIGASPASTGGGIKTSTFALSILNIFSLAKGKEHIEIYRRQISDNSIRRAFAIIFLSFIIIGLSVFCVSTFDPEKKLLDIAFECFSAYGTVGLSLGITSTLSEASKFVIVMTMFLGRIGTLTLLIAFFRKVHHMYYRYPTESILIN